MSNSAIPAKRSICVVFDDHTMFADSFSKVIEDLNIFISVHAFNQKDSAIQYLKNNSGTPVYFFLDYFLNDGNSLPVINEVKRLHKRIKIIIISSVSSLLHINTIRTYSPDAIVSKASGIDVLLDCIRTIEQNEHFYCPVMTQLLSSGDNQDTLPFSPREIEILHHFALGKSIMQTAEDIYLSKHTIVAHRRNMMKKSNSRSITELLAYSKRMGIIE